MLVFNEITQQYDRLEMTSRAIVKINNDNVTFGYVPRQDSRLVHCILKKEYGEDLVLLLYTEDTAPYLGFSKKRGYYFIIKDHDEGWINHETMVLGNGNFPYILKRHYEARESFDLFDGKQILLKENVDYSLSKYLKYSFGLEFETSQGYIPEMDCYRDGLIPLRDGSISGVEYSTIVLDGNRGLNLLNQQIETLKEFTYFNKECSLHIHFGGYPIDPKAIFILYNVLKSIEPEIECLNPRDVYNTARYKKSGKDYCKKLFNTTSFNGLYNALTGIDYMGDLHQPHPNDVERTHKWDCHSRYVWCNLLNMVCYDSCKTVEFRFLRPTYNFTKIYVWMYIFNAILLYSEKLNSEIKSKADLTIRRKISSVRPTLFKMVDEVYPQKIAIKLKSYINKLNYLKLNQDFNEDFCGRMTTFEDKFFNEIF